MIKTDFVFFKKKKEEKKWRGEKSQAKKRVVHFADGLLYFADGQFCRQCLRNGGVTPPPFFFLDTALDVINLYTIRTITKISNS